MFGFPLEEFAFRHYTLLPITIYVVHVLGLQACINPELPVCLFLEEKKTVLTIGVFPQHVLEVVAGDGELESDLGQLPGHHPLIKDGMSDEGLP